MNTLSSVRAFVGGESYWSKYQKESVFHLNQYANTQSEADYQKFLEAINVPLQDKVARLELQKGNPDVDIATKSFIAAKNNPNDIMGMTKLFMLFHQTELMAKSVQYWTEGDEKIEMILDLAEQLHTHIRTGKPSPTVVNRLMAQVNEINLELTPIEESVSNSLGDASRKAKQLIGLVMVVITVILMTLGILLTRRMVVKNVHSANALRISEERWKFALDGARDGVWDWDLNTNGVQVSKQWRFMLGYEDHEIVGSYADWEQRVHPEDLPKVLTALKAYVNGDANKYSIEHRLRCKDGSYKWILTRGMVVSSRPDGKPDRIIGTHTDIDELKTIEASLRESDTNQRALLEAMMDGVFVAQDYRFIFANPILPELLGYKLEEFIGLPFDQVVAPESLHVWNRRFAARTSGDVEPVKHYQVKFLYKGGKKDIWLDLHASKVMFRGKASVMGILRDISKQKEAEEMIWHQANFDTLTGLPNRRMFRDRLEQEIKKSDRTGLSFAMMFLDLDHFKIVNDTMGHEMGDQLLKEASRRLKSCVRETDTVARLGGDEFVLLLTETVDLKSLERIAEEILSQLTRPFEIVRDPIWISASIGITLYPVDAHDFDNLLKNADQAMYAAKAEGRNRYSYFTPSMQAAAQSKMRLANDLRHALNRHEFKLVYQPIVEVGTGLIRKAEALIRWQHPIHGLISPAEFIPVAEETGVIVEIGDWVFHEAATQLVKWHQTIHPDFQVSINKSPVQFRNAHSNWIERMASMGLPAASLVVEITEGMLLEANDNVSNKLLEFKKAGIQVAIDDFGTGYSSLSYLKKYDIEYIKIDQSFVRNLSHDTSDLGICEAIILMAHKLDMRVIAEGVETLEQYQLLEGADCDYVQGYYFSKPVTVEEFEKLLVDKQPV